MEAKTLSALNWMLLFLAAAFFTGAYVGRYCLSPRGTQKRLVIEVHKGESPADAKFIGTLTEGWAKDDK